MKSHQFPSVKKSNRNESLKFSKQLNQNFYFRQLSNDNKENTSKLSHFLQNVSAKNCPNSFKVPKKAPQIPENIVPRKTTNPTQNPVQHNSEFPKHYFFVGRGNNESVIKEVMAKRLNWSDADDNLKVANFRWQQTSKNVFWDTLNAPSNQSFNHFEFNSELGKKDNLVKNLKRHIDKNGLKLHLFDIVPFTVEFLVQNNKMDFQLSFIKNLLETVGEAQNGTDIKLDSLFSLKSKKDNQAIVSSPSLSLTKQTPESLCFGGIEKLPGVFVGSKNLWLLKPTCLNRGKGIELVNTFEDFQQQIKKFKDYSSEEGVYTKKGSVYKKILVQKYCENLLLIDNRKFDIRVWCLVDQNLNIYLCKEGYLRMSSFVYNIEKCNDKFIHLTNNAVQKHSEKYSLYEKGNQKSFEDLKNFLENNTAFSFDSIYSRIKFVCSLVLKSVLGKLNYNRRKTCFEIFGLDFILDREGGAWLLEANVNPCLETSSPLLEKLIPRMLDDAFKLTIDKTYRCNIDPSIAFPVNGLTDAESIWDGLHGANK